MNMKTLGILGGVGPQTTSKVYHSVIDYYRANKRSTYPSIIIYNLPFPFKVEQEAIFEGRNSHKMVPYLIEGAKILEKSGATFGILPCNTLHKYIDEIRASVSMPFLSILDEVIDTLKSSHVRKVAILATQSSVNERLYDGLLDENKIEAVYPAKKDQRDLDEIIIRLINGKERKADIKKIERISSSLIKRGSQAILLACTDLQGIAYKIKSKIPFIDSTDLLIKASLRELLSKQ